MSARPLAIALVSAAALCSALPAEADVRRLEAVGAVPLSPDRRGGSAPRDAAIQSALREAVSRVARDFLLDSDPDAELEQPLSEVLGREMVPYTARFRILEDRGAGPALFTNDPGATREYVVIVEVHVDAERVKSRLVDAGLLTRSARGLVHRLRVDVLGLDRYGAYESLRAALIESAGARSVVPLQFEKGRALLEVEAEAEGQELVDRLLRRLPPGLEISPLRVGRERLQLQVRWTPPPTERRPAVGASGRRGVPSRRR